MKNIKNARSLAVLELLKRISDLFETVPTINEKFCSGKLTIKEFSSELKSINEIKIEK